jgi:hypothetical protein
MLDVFREVFNWLPLAFVINDKARAHPPAVHCCALLGLLGRLPDPRGSCGSWRPKRSRDA